MSSGRTLGKSSQQSKSTRSQSSAGSDSGSSVGGAAPPSPLLPPSAFGKSEKSISPTTQSATAATATSTAARGGVEQYICRRPLLHMIVLYAFDHRVRRYAEEVQDAFLEKGINCFIQTELDDQPGSDIKTEHLVEVLGKSTADFIVVIGDRNLKNRTCQAKRQGKLVEMPVEERTRTIAEEWGQQMKVRGEAAFDGDVTRLTRDQVVDIVQNIGGMKNVRNRLAALKTATDELRDWKFPKLPSVSSSSSTTTSSLNSSTTQSAQQTATATTTMMDEKMIGKLTHSQNSAIRLHKDLVASLNVLLELPVDSAQDGVGSIGGGRGVALSSLSRPIVQGISKQLKERLIVEVEHLIPNIEHTGATLSELANKSSLWEAYRQEFEKEKKPTASSRSIYSSSSSSTASSLGSGSTALSSGVGSNLALSNSFSASTPSKDSSDASRGSAKVFPPSPPRPGQWSCTRCTFINQEASTKCVMCDNPKEDDGQWSVKGKKKQKGAQQQSSSLDDYHSPLDSTSMALPSSATTATKKKGGAVLVVKPTPQPPAQPQPQVQVVQPSVVMKQASSPPTQPAPTPTVLHRPSGGGNPWNIAPAAPAPTAPSSSSTVPVNTTAATMSQTPAAMTKSASKKAKKQQQALAQAAEAAAAAAAAAQLATSTSPISLNGLISQPSIFGGSADSLLPVPTTSAVDGWASSGSVVGGATSPLSILPRPQPPKYQPPLSTPNPAVNIVVNNAATSLGLLNLSSTATPPPQPPSATGYPPQPSSTTATFVSPLGELNASSVPAKQPSVFESLVMASSAQSTTTATAVQQQQQQASTSSVGVSVGGGPYHLPQSLWALSSESQSMSPQPTAPPPNTQESFDPWLAYQRQATSPNPYTGFLPYSSASPFIPAPPPPSPFVAMPTGFGSPLYGPSFGAAAQFFSAAAAQQQQQQSYQSTTTSTSEQTADYVVESVGVDSLVTMAPQSPTLSPRISGASGGSAASSPQKQLPPLTIPSNLPLPMQLKLQLQYQEMQKNPNGVGSTASFQLQPQPQRPVGRVVPTPVSRTSAASAAAASSSSVSQPCLVCGQESTIECNSCAFFRRKGLDVPPAFFCGPEHQQSCWAEHNSVHKEFADKLPPSH